MKTRKIPVDSEYLFAENLRFLRQKQKPYLSQTRLAEELGVCRTTYSGYERGVRQAPAFFIANVAGYFEVPADKLLRETLWKE